MEKKSLGAPEGAYTNRDMLKILHHVSGRYSTNNALFRKNTRFLCENLIPSSDLIIVSGHGIVLKTTKGTMYDFASMSLNCILGQNDPWVNANLVSYILSGRPSFASTRVGTELYYEMAEKIAKLSGMKDAVVDHRQCNGSDVTELAIVAAYKHRKKNQKYVVSFKGSYHGQNLTSFIVSDLQQGNRFFVDDGISTVFLDTPTHTQPCEKEKSLSKNDESILKNLKKIGGQAFAVIIEPIQVSNRVNISSRLFLKSLKELCEQLEVPLIFDDIQTGYGWLGTFSSAQYFGVTPNLMAVSKGLTAGYGPLAALIMDSKYGDLPLSTVLKTNGADLRSFVAAKAVIERLKGVDTSLIPDNLNESLKLELKEGLIARFPQKEGTLKNSLISLQERHPALLGEIRGAGLIWCIEILDDKGRRDVALCTRIQKDLLEKGVLVRDLKGTLLFKVPMVFKEVELQAGFSIIDMHLAKIKR